MGFSSPPSNQGPSEHLSLSCTYLSEFQLAFRNLTGPESYMGVSPRLCRRPLILSCLFVPVHPWACFATSLLPPLLCGVKAMWQWLRLDYSTGNYQWTLQNHSVHPSTSSAISLNSYAKCLGWNFFMSNIQCQDSWSHTQWPTSSKALQLVPWQHHDATEVSGELNQRGKTVCDASGPVTI